jgi:AcrR family transcriptional regulator
MATSARDLERRNDVRDAILDATRQCILETGYAQLSTRRITERAGVALSQLHYHFGSKHGLVLAVLRRENERLLGRQTAMYEDSQPLWKQWEQACNYLEEDLESGYVRILQEMTAAGWSNEEIADAVRADLRGWFTLLTSVLERFIAAHGPVGPFRPKEVAALVGLAFLGAEAMLLLGVPETELPCRAALRRFGEIIRAVETAGSSD